MVLLPTPLKAFTDVMEEVKTMLRVCALHLYGWCCDHEVVSDAVAQVSDWKNWDHYPKSWPTPDNPSRPRGTVAFTGKIKRDADRRKESIRKDLLSAGPHYPREAVARALSYWQLDL